MTLGPSPAKSLAAVLAAVAFGAASSTGEGGSQRIKDSGDAVSAEYGFRNFNGDRLQVDYQIKKAALKAYESEYGYYIKEVDALKADREKARRAAFEKAVKAGKSQEELNADLAAVVEAYEAKKTAYFLSRGFRLQKDGVVSADIPGIAKRSAAHVQPVALAIDKVAAQKSYTVEELAGAVLSLAQTALVYDHPPVKDGEKNTGGVLPPVTALVKGWGDCDTKSGLVGAVLANWPKARVVGVAVPGHYLLGILANPGKGDLFVEHGGARYVLLEPAGPAWLHPGKVADETVALLEAGDGYRIEPFF